MAGIILPTKSRSGTVAYLGFIHLCYLLSACAALTSGTGCADFSLQGGYMLLTLGNGMMLTSLPGLVWLEDFHKLQEPSWITSWKNLLMTV